MNMDADHILTEWGECINCGDLARIMKLYVKDAMLWGTFSKILRDDHELIRDYFQGLFAKDNLKVKFESSKNRVYADIFIYSGSYELSYEENGLQVFPARYTFVIRKIGEDDFKIVEHHSSLIPA